MQEKEASDHLMTTTEALSPFTLGKLIPDSDLNNPQNSSLILQEKRKAMRKLNKDYSEMRNSLITKMFAEALNSHIPSYRMPPVRKFRSDPNKRSPSYKRIPARNFSEVPDDTQVFWSRVESLGWKPETRQEASLSAVAGKLYLIGGVSRSINSDVSTYTPLYSKWERLEPKGVEAEPRFGHSALEFNSSIILFGGGTNFNTQHKLRECLNGVKVFSPSSCSWSYIKTQGTYIATRKYHCAAIVGKHMFVHGGLNQKNNLLSDTALLNLETQNWKSIIVKGPGPTLNAYHTAQAVLASDQTQTKSIYDIPASSDPSIKQPGIYVFGGVGPDKKAHNNLWVLQMGQRPLRWLVPLTSGSPPSPRFLHTLSHNERLNLLIVFGGRVDLNNTHEYTCFNDVYILKLSNLMWARVKVGGEMPDPRSGHCAATSSTKLYIFGGVSTTVYCGSDLYVLELEPSVASQMEQEQEKRLAKEKEIEFYHEKKELEYSKNLERRKAKSNSRFPSRRFESPVKHAASFILEN